MSRIRKIIGLTTATTTPTGIDMDELDTSVICMSGTLWVSPLKTAVADVTCLKLEAGMALPLGICRHISLVSDSTATYQVIGSEE